MNYQTLKVRYQDPICWLQIHRPQANNTINDQLITECNHVLEGCERRREITIIVLEGLPEVFCFGADFQSIHDDEPAEQRGPEPLYDLWMKLATGPFITIAHVRGKVNAGGVGFVAACDIVLGEDKAVISLSELLFGLFPACVLPFLIRRVGFQKAHYLTLMTQPVTAQKALEWGLFDACDSQSEALLRRHLLRLRRLSRKGIIRYKAYMNQLHEELVRSKPLALAANLEIFTDPENLAGIQRFVATGQFPWERP